MFLQIHPDNPDKRKIIKVIDCLKNGGVIIYPTDSVYGFGCDIYNQKAVGKICQLRKINPKKANLSFVCTNLSHLATFTKPIDNDIYKLIRSITPGPFTFILKASSSVPKLFKNNKRTLGIRLPNNVIAQTIVNELQHPLLSASLKNEEYEMTDYMIDPKEIYDRYHKLVDIIIDGGFGGTEPSTVLDCTVYPVEIIREGAGKIS